MVKNPKNWQPDFLYGFLSCNSSLGNKGIDMIFFLLERSELEDYRTLYDFFCSYFFVEIYRITIRVYKLTRLWPHRSHCVYLLAFC